MRVALAGANQARRPNGARARLARSHALDRAWQWCYSTRQSLTGEQTGGEMAGAYMRLEQLLRELPHTTIRGPTDVEVANLVYDSREVGPGSLFVAIEGFHVDGHDFIADALNREAVAVVAESGRGAQQAAAWHETPAPLVEVPDSRAALADLAAAFFRHPARHLLVVGITGTDGKTTTSFLTSSVLEAAGHTTALFGTVDFKIGSRQWPNKTRQTSPEAVETQAFLRRSLDEGCTAAVLESSSHGLALHRLDHCDYDVAVLTNVTHEHLDFHQTVETYRLAKAHLFEMLSQAVKVKGADAQRPGKGIGVVNLDDPNANLYVERTPGDVWTYAVNDRSARVRARDILDSPHGVSFVAESPHGAVPVHLNLPGTFNVYNALAAFCVGLSLGAEPETAARGLEAVEAVRGRMQRIDEGQPFTVLVDYAHTPEALQTVLGLLRPVVSGQMIAVFGSAGERDREKRSRQGEIAARHCEFFVITDEDPRLEDREAILAEIAAGAERAGKRAGQDFLCIADRRQAIRTALERAGAGDLVALLGKGHEGCIFYADHVLPWDEAGVARQLLHEMGYGTALQQNRAVSRRISRNE